MQLAIHVIVASPRVIFLRMAERDGDADADIRQQLQLCFSTLQQIAGNLAIPLTTAGSTAPLSSQSSSQPETHSSSLAAAASQLQAASPVPSTSSSVLVAGSSSTNQATSSQSPDHGMFVCVFQVVCCVHTLFMQCRAIILFLSSEADATQFSIKSGCLPFNKYWIIV